MDMKKVRVSQMEYRKANLVQFNFDISPDLKSRFKQACDKNNLKPTTVLKTFIKEYIEKNYN